MATVEIDLGLNGPQLVAHEMMAPGVTVSIPWSRGVGKSWFELTEAMLLIAQHYGEVRSQALKPFRGYRVICLMDTKTHFAQVHRQRLVEFVESDWAALGGKVNLTTLEATFPDGSWIKPVSAAEHTSQASRGLRCDCVIGDECDDIPISVFNSVAVPWFSEPWSYKQRLFGGTPRKGRKGLLYHLHKLGLSQDPKHDRYRTLHATYRDAPETVDRAEVEEARENSPPAVFRREWECDFDAAEGLVYGDVFDERFHVRNPPVDTVLGDVIIGGDAGFEDPGVLLVIGIQGHGNDAVGWVLEEHCHTKQTQDFWVDVMRSIMARFPRARLFHDPSAPSLIAAYRKLAHASPREVDNNILDGISSVANLFKIRGEGENRAARLYVSPSCKNLIWELGAYHRRRDPQDPDRVLEDIVDKWNHSADALRYAVHNGMPRSSGARHTHDLEARQ